MSGKDRIGAALLLLVFVAFGWLSQRIPLLPFQADQAFHARTMPQALAVLGCLLALVLLARPGDRARPALQGLNWRVAVAFLVLMSAYGLTIRPLGFLISTTAFLAIGFRLLGERRPWKLAGVAVPVAVGFWWLMARGLDVYVAPWPPLVTGPG